MATVTVNDTPIRSEDNGGDGPVVFFSHGFLMDHTMFDASRGLVMVEGAAHAPNVSHPEIVNEALGGFLASL